MLRNNIKQLTLHVAHASVIVGKFPVLGPERQVDTRRFTKRACSEMSLHYQVLLFILFVLFIS